MFSNFAGKQTFVRALGADQGGISPCEKWPIEEKYWDFCNYVPPVQQTTSEIDAEFAETSEMFPDDLSVISEDLNWILDEELVQQPVEDNACEGVRCIKLYKPCPEGYIDGNECCPNTGNCIPDPDYLATRRIGSERPVKTGLYTSPNDGIQQEVSYIADEILIGYKDTATASQIASFETAQGLDKIEDYDFIKSSLYLTPTDPIQLSTQLRDNPIIEFIEPNFTRGISGGIPSNSATAEVERNSTAVTGSIIGVVLVVGLFLLLRE